MAAYLVPVGDDVAVASAEDDGDYIPATPLGDARDTDDDDGADWVVRCFSD